jgi:hypothetical protein
MKINYETPHKIVVDLEDSIVPEIVDLSED